MRALILFPSQTFNPRAVDEAFAEEHEAALRAGFDAALIDQEALDEGRYERAARMLPSGEGIYRGWMLTVAQYEGLYDALAARGVRLINAPDAYHHCHHLPASFDLIRARSPQSAWIPLEGGVMDLDRVAAVARGFGARPLVIKDYVKSRKHEWAEACFIPDAQDEAAVRRVASTFIERQGDWLAGGVVLRAFLSLKPIGVHPQSGAPLTREHRVFVLDGAPLIQTAYWAEGAYPEGEAPLEALTPIIQSIKSRFFTLDLAEDEAGRWWIIELGDGQVAGRLTLGADAFYEALAGRLASESSRSSLRTVPSWPVTERQ